MMLTYVTINNFKNFVFDSNTRSYCSDLFGFSDLQRKGCGIVTCMAAYASMFNDDGSG